MTTISSFVINDQHPSLAGHFPGRPIIPGVVILEHILQCFQHINPDTSIYEISKVKFIHPMQINVESQVEFKAIQTSKFNFSVQQSELIIATGQLQVNRT